MPTYEDWPKNFKGNQPGYSSGVNNPDPDPTTYSPYWSNYQDWRSGGGRLYRSMLRNRMRNELDPEKAYRNQAYRTLGSQQAESNRMIRASGSEAFGGLGASSPLVGSLMAQNSLSAPYAEMGLRGRELGVQGGLAAGQALIGSKQAQANWYSTMTQPIFQQYALDLQKESIENAAALGLAGLDSGGGLISGIFQGLGL